MKTQIQKRCRRFVVPLMRKVKRRSRNIKMKNFTLKFPSEVQFFRRGVSKDFYSNGSFHEAVSSVLVLGQVFGLIPVIGIKAKYPYNNKLYFTWKSKRAVYSICVFLSLLWYTGLNTVWAIDTNFQFNKFRKFKLNNLL